MPHVRNFAAIGKAVDKANFVIKDVAIISTGCAKGHGMLVDATTLQTVKECCERYESGLKVKFNSSTFNHGDGSVCGLIPKGTLRIDEQAGCLRGDFHILKNYAEREFLVELAETMGDTFGLSIDFDCEAREVSGSQYATCKEIFAVTVVDQPAANPTGLWSVGEPNKTQPTNQPNNMPLDAAAKTEVQAMLSEAIRPVSEALTTIGGQLKALSEAANAPKVNLAEVPEEEKELSGIEQGDDEETKMRKVAAFRAGGAQSKALLQFMRKLGNKAANNSAGAGDDKNKQGDSKTAFSRKVEELAATGVKNAHAMAVEQFPDLYNQHMTQRTAAAK